MHEELEELIREFESLKARVQALEVIAGVDRPPKEKVKGLGHDSTEDQE